MTQPAPLASRAGRSPSMRRDLLSAYFATGAKVGSWAVVSAMVFRFLGPGQFALLALIRGTIGLLNYVSLGLAPAIIHEASKATTADVSTLPQNQSGALNYFSADRAIAALRRIYANGLIVAVAATTVGSVLLLVFAAAFGVLFKSPIPFPGLSLLVALMGFGTLFRLIGDVPGTVLQVRSRIAEDNWIVACGDIFWMLLSVGACVQLIRWQESLLSVCEFYAFSGLFALLLRLYVAASQTQLIIPRISLLDRAVVRRLMSFGLLVVLAQLADYLYAPTDYILIDHLLQPVDIANYAPAIQIDAALLLLVAGLSSVLLPRTALAHARGDRAVVRQYFVRGTVVSLLGLGLISVLVWVLSPWIFQVWLGNSMPETRRILPVLLICTAVGGSSAVGRSILLAVGRVKPFTISVLIAGVTNVVCSYVFAQFFHWGLFGIVLGTVVAVVGRCGIWMPWYVWRVLSEGGEIGEVEDFPPDTGL